MDIKTEKLFVYGTLMNKRLFENVTQGNVEVLSIVPAMIQGKLYNGGNFPIVIPKSEGRKARAPVIVHGALITFKTNEEGFKCLDSYEGCSKARILKNSPSDLYHRVIMSCKKVHYNSLADFVSLNYYVEEEDINAWVYIGNMEHEFINKTCNQLRRKNGIVWKSYFMTFDNKKY